METSRYPRLALPIAAMCAALLFAAGCQNKEHAVPPTAEQPSRGGRPPGKGPPPEAERQATGTGEMREHPEELKLDPPQGRELFLSVSAPAGGDGTLDRPWNNLDSALRQLRPGDRLVMMVGRYEGPLVLDKRYPAGERGRPIELYARVDAVLGRPRKAAATDAPLLSIRQDGWTVIGLEIFPGHSTAPALEIAAASDVRVFKGHFHDGHGDGVRIEPGSRRVTIEESHIHMFGERRGRSGKGAKGEQIGVRIAPDTREIFLRLCNIHNISGPTVKTLTPEEYAATGGRPGLPAAARVNIEATSQQANWPERGE